VAVRTLRKIVLEGALDELGRLYKTTTRAWLGQNNNKGLAQNNKGLA
jgi:hypothetical protein